MSPILRDILAGHLADPTSTWSAGTFGAVAEFSRAPEEAVDAPDPLTRVTPRGGLRIDAHPDLTLVASEALTRQSWSQRVALCLPEASCRMSERRVLTALGPDRDALRPDDRTAVLFDLGLGCRQVDVCVRVADTVLAAELHRQCGRGLFEPDNPAIGAILAASPPRVVLARLGRMEVNGPIPPHDGQSPEGPHTHILPNLLATGRTHAATEPIPTGLVPCMHVYPCHPSGSAIGHPAAFNEERHARFQHLLEMYGDPVGTALKQRVRDQVMAGDDPGRAAVPDDRRSRTAARIALRQMAAAGPITPTLARWIAHHDRPAVRADGRADRG